MNFASSVANEFTKFYSQPIILLPTFGNSIKKRVSLNSSTERFFCVLKNTVLSASMLNTLFSIFISSNNSRARMKSDPWVIFNISTPTLSRDTLRLKAASISGSFAAVRIEGSIVQSYRVAKRTVRRIRKGSSRKVSKGGRGVRTIRWCRSSIPRVVKSSIVFVLIL